MGMAAGQARLLSITSRMSDNELRAQIINNNKMRLATQSSQVSEAYVTALNEAQMMFTNYDKDNNTSYQKLTFNALTAYNPYNNQYILTNNSGNVLLSERDAVNYENANGDVTKFLQAYGLENTTSYWDSLAVYSDGKKIQYKTDATLSGADTFDLANVAGGAQYTNITKYLRDLYEGNIKGDNSNPKLHPGYMDEVSSEEYYTYTSALAKYNEKLDDLLPTIQTGMDNKLNTLGSPSFDSIDPSGWTDATATDGMESLKKIIESAKDFVITTEPQKTSAINLLDSLKTKIDDNKDGTMVLDTYTQDDCIIENDGLGTLTLKYKKDDGSPGDAILSVTKIGMGALATYTAQHVGADGSLQNASYDGTNMTYNYTDDDGNVIQTITTTGLNSLDFSIGAENKEFKIQDTAANTLDNKKEVGQEVIKALKNAIYSIWEPMHRNGSSYTFMDKSSDEYKQFEQSAKDLAAAVGINSVNADDYFKLGEIDFIQNKLKGSGDNSGSFQKVYDAYVLDCIMNTFGEPKYTWIDTKNPNENGETKAQWYENLFTRIQKGGYKVLQDGLASSNEWIQFAFESGIVTMEQVDANKNWQPLIYSNCSDITEQTNDAAVAKAEAEYKTAMNKIENKDKRYDLELKNIDTEHNSLQTEYDSIKTAIDKNIERTFKLYS